MIAITGATGFLGSHLAKALAAKGEPFVCLSRKGSPRRDRLLGLPCEIRELDFSDDSEVRAALSGCDRVFHLMGRINASEESLRQVNVDYTRSLVRAACAGGVSRFVFVSSVAAMRCHGAYGRSKRAAEEIVEQSGLNYLIFRPAFIYGKGDTHNTGLMIKTLNQWPLIPLLGGGGFKLQPVFVADVTALLLQALNSEYTCRTYPVAGPEQISLRDILTHLAGQMGRRCRLVTVPLKPVQWVTGLYLKCFPNTRLPAKQILELDRHEAFDIAETQRDFHFDPIPFRDGVKRLFAEESRCAA